ncbi:MAG: hypothetical protein HZB39_05285 [Planctomycetes bacterium]|nr:hypothetical protein [Planctomycetota bacterium]
MSGYATALADQTTSGLSMAAYAAKPGVNPTTLYEWRRRLGPSGQGVTPTPPCTKLVEVTMARPSAASRGGMVLRLARGCRSIEVPRDFDADDLRRLIAVVESC